MQPSKDRLRELQGNYDMALSQLEQCLDTLPNLVDPAMTERTCDMLENKTSTTQPHGDVKLPLFSAGCYEEIGTICIMTERGARLEQALEGALLTFLQKTRAFPNAQILHLPLCVESRSKPEREHTENKQTEECGVPSWRYILQHLHSNQTYYDRNLPRCQILKCSGPFQQPQQPLMTKKPKQPTAWYQRLSTRKELQLLLVTGSSLEVDSRKAQLETMSHIAAFYQTMLPHCRLFLKGIAADQLGTDECSRLSLEARMESGNKHEIAYLSNYLDFYSSTTRHGSSMERHHVHVLHGNVCRYSECLDVMAEVCATSQGIVVPALLRNNQGAPLPEILDYQRLVISGKGGRRIVEPLASSVLKVGRSLIAGAPNPDEIRREAASCPFEFLPFYYR